MFLGPELIHYVAAENNGKSLTGPRTVMVDFAAATTSMPASQCA